MSTSPSPTETTAIVSQIDTQINNSFKINSNKLFFKRKFIILIALFAVFTCIIYKPLPNDFPQPIKYRLICFGADILTVVVSLFYSSLKKNLE